jgi:hypothetical protein
MKKQILVLAGLAAIVASSSTAFAASADPTAGVKADIATLLSMSKTQHDLVIADAQSISGATDRKGALETLHSHRQAAVKLLQAQRDKIAVELKDLRSAKIDSRDLKDLLEQSSTTLKAESQEVETAVAAARKADRQAAKDAKHAAKDAKHAADHAARQDRHAAELAARQAKQQAQQAQRLAEQKARQDKQTAELAARQAKQAAELAARQAKQTADLAAAQAKLAAQRPPAAPAAATP